MKNPVRTRTEHPLYSCKYQSEKSWKNLIRVMEETRKGKEEKTRENKRKQEKTRENKRDGEDNKKENSKREEEK